MGDMLIRNVSEAMKQDIAERADRNGHSLSDEAKLLLQKAITDSHRDAPRTQSALDSMREVFAPLTHEEREEYARLMDEIEAERKKDFGRPVEGFE